jgi:hypothetical protein
MSTDNIQVEAPYHTIDIKFIQNIYSKRVDMNLFVLLNNITNQSYEVISYYPAPMRSIQLGININLKTKNNQ